MPKLEGVVLKWNEQNRKRCYLEFRRYRSAGAGSGLDRRG
jgi:hypothetical protein